MGSREIELMTLETALKNRNHPFHMREDVKGALFVRCVRFFGGFAAKKWPSPIVIEPFLVLGFCRRTTPLDHDHDHHHHHN